MPIGVDKDNYNYEYTLLDDMPFGWRIAFGELICEEIKNILDEYKANNDFHIVQFLEKFERDGIIPDIMECSSAFVLYKVWSNFVNGNEAETAKYIAHFEQHFEPSEKFYELLADLYKKPPVYTYTPANEIKYLEYSSKMLDFIEK